MQIWKAASRHTWNKHAFVTKDGKSVTNFFSLSPLMPLADLILDELQRGIDNAHPRWIVFSSAEEAMLAHMGNQTIGAGDMGAPCEFLSVICATIQKKYPAPYFSTFVSEDAPIVDPNLRSRLAIQIGKTY